MPSHSDTMHALALETEAAYQQKSTRSQGNDYDVFSSLTEIKPGTIPLLVQMPDGNREQVDVPLDSTIDDISSMFRQGSDDVRLSFGNVDLPPGASLMDTNIVDAYEHAGSLLQVIGNARGDAVAKAAALDSACAVIENVSNGIKDMERLCAAAMEPPSFPDGPVPPSPRTGALMAAGAEEAERDTPKELDDADFKMLNSMLTRSAAPSRLDKNAVDVPPPPRPATPSELVHGLSRRLPLLFPPSAATAAVGAEEKDIHNGQQDEQPFFGMRHPSLGVQPSISSIRAARRKARENMPMELAAQEDSHAATAMTIGNSTNGMPLPTDLPGRSIGVAGGGPIGPPGIKGEGSVWMAGNAKSTWLEDVMKTWEVGVVRQSGVLEKTKHGQELNEYFNALEDEAQREEETEDIEAQTEEVNSETPSQGSTQPLTHAGDSEDDAEEESHSGSTINDKSRVNDNMPNPDKERTQMNRPPISRHCNVIPRAKDPVSQMMQAQSAATAAIRGTSSVMSVKSSQGSHATTNMYSGPATASPLLGHSSDHWEESDMRCASSAKPPPRIVRQATKIAPAPNVAMGTLPNGMLQNSAYPEGVAPPGVTWPPQPPLPGPKKRGRKRKNPELTDEERALVRKEQNRESAKLSRVRRKVIAAEYEGRLKVLVGENTLLRKQVEGLNNRLVYLQSLLTVSVRPEPGPGEQ